MPVATKRTRVLDDVLSFAQVGLGLDLYDGSSRPIPPLTKAPDMSALKAAWVVLNGSGKTQRVVAVSALRWLNVHPNSLRVIIT